MIITHMDTMCAKCGGLIGRSGVSYGWGGTWCHCPLTPNVYSFPYTPPVYERCEHCWCKDCDVNGATGSYSLKQDHKKCCNCGIKKAK